MQSTKTIYVINGYCILQKPKRWKMTTIMAAPKISAGNRIALSDDVCDALGVSIGERIVIIRTEQGDIILKKAIA